MIPKVIHYCWFGGKPKSAETEAMIDTWRRAMPGAVIKEWNETNFDSTVYPYAREALAAGSWAHVSDVCRMHALYNDGGVYFDTDVELLKSLDPFMNQADFIGMEEAAVGTGVIGAQPGRMWIKRFLDYYSSHHFINIWGHAVRTPNPVLLTQKILPGIPASEQPHIYPFDVFCAKRYTTGQIEQTADTVAIHHFKASWRKRKTWPERIANLYTGFKIRHFGL